MNYFFLVFVPNFFAFIGFLGAFGFVASLAGVVIYLYKKDNSYSQECLNDAKLFGKKVLKGLILSMSMIFITCFMPSKEDIIQLRAMSIACESQIT